MQPGEKNGVNSSRLHSDRLHAPAVVTLIHYTGVQHDPIFSGRRHGTAVGLTDFAHRSHLISSCAQLGGQHNLVSCLQGVDFPKMVGDTPVMASQSHGSVPDTGVGKVSGTLGQGAAAGALIDLYRQANGRDLQRTKYPPE